MREVTVYYAYDDSEFFDRDECLAYEQDALHKAQEIDAAYCFFDENLITMYAPSVTEDIEDWIVWLGEVGDKCTCIRRRANLSPETEMFYREMWGYCILNEDFNNELGMFCYNYDKDEWVKVDE